jgi:cyclopropane-fatty-acyl-phospholipid synthase
VSASPGTAAGAPTLGVDTDRPLEERPLEDRPVRRSTPSGAGEDVSPAAPDRRLALARHLIPILNRALPRDGGLTVELAEPGAGVPVMGDGAPRARAIVRDPDALGRLLSPPLPDTFAEAYVRGDLEIEGDVRTAIKAAEAIDFRRLGPTDARRAARWGFELAQTTNRATSRGRVAVLAGRRHSPARDQAAIRFHYDVGNDFYALWLDHRMTYSCAYFASHDETLDDAQEAKLELICRKLDLRTGQRLLDIGCGWGSLINYAADRNGVHAVGITLSEQQAQLANARAEAIGLGDQSRAEVLDYRSAGTLGEFDAVASVGMFEHVGRENLAAYFAAAYGAVKPGGLFLNHGIASGDGRGPLAARLRSRGSHFVERYVFPDGELLPIEETIRVARAAGFEVIDVQSLQPHYALTLAAWVNGLELNWDAAVARSSDEIARTWRLYMSAARLGFERGRLDVFQVLLARPLGRERPAPRALRRWW